MDRNTVKKHFFTNKELIDGESYCWPVGRGPFTSFNNLVLGVLAVLLVFIMIAYDFNALSGIITFSICPIYRKYYTKG